MNDIKTLYDNLNIEKKEHSEVEITGEIPESMCAQFRTKAIKKLEEDVNISGFRKGHIPENILVKKIGEQVVLEEVAQLALSDAYPQIVLKNKLHVIGKPNITITKLAAGNPIGFKIQTAVMPEITLPDCKKIAQEVLKNSQNEKIEITDEDVNGVMLQLRKNKWHIENKAGDSKKEPEEKDLPEFTDVLVKTLGDFKDVSDFKTKMKENLLAEKKMKAKQKQRAEIGDKIIEQVVTSLPHVLVESELEKMLGQFKNDVAALGTPFEEYLKKINKTEEDLRGEWKVDAEKRAKLQLSLNTIAKKENITAPEEDIKRQTDHVLKHYKDANPESVRIYVTTLITNEKVFEFLENSN